MSLIRPRRTLAIVAITLVSCSSQLLPATTPTVPVAPLRLYVTPPVSELVTMLTNTYSRQNPGISFDIIVQGERNVVPSVMRDSQGYLITDYLDEYLDNTTSLWAAPIGQDGIALIAHPDVGVSNFSLEQVRLIYNGDILRWNEVGGEDLPIIAFTREDSAGIQSALFHHVLGSLPISSNIRIAPSSAAMRFAVERTPGALGYVPVSHLDGRIHALALDGVEPTLSAVYTQQYPLRTILYVAGQHEPDAADTVGQHFRAFIGWMQSPDGQAIIAESVAPMIDVGH